jgi:hypothetical protein
MFSTLLAGLAGLALVAGAPFSSQAQSSKSWGPKHTTYWSTEATGEHEPGKFMQTQAMTPPAVQPAAQPGQRMYYQPQGKRVRAQQRVRQPQTRLRQQQPQMKPGEPTQGTPPAERTDQPPADAKPSAPPSQGQQPMTPPGATPK